MTIPLNQQDDPGYEYWADSTPKPSVVDVQNAPSAARVETTPSLSKVDSVRRNVRKGLKYVLAAAGALIIMTAGESTTSSKSNAASVEEIGGTQSKFDYLQNTAELPKAPITWHMFNIGHDNRTFNIDVKYPEPLNYRIEDVSDPSNFKEITTVIEENKTKIRAVMKLDKPASEGVRYSVRLAENPEQKPEGLIPDGIVPISDRNAE